MNLETVYAELFSKVAAIAGFRTAARTWKDVSEVPFENMPALFQLQGDIDTVQKFAMPMRYELPVELWIYAHSRAEVGEAPSSVLNPLLDAVVSALAPDPATGKQDLGMPDTVSSCAINGSITILEGVIGETIICVVPVHIVAT